METALLVDQLSNASAYPYELENVVVCHTHISAVFLAGPYAFKIKKPVALGFLDFTTLALRRQLCEEEVRLNRRLAPDVYIGVVPITKTESGVQVDGHGAAIEWAVKMYRLNDEATFQYLLLHNHLAAETVENLAEKIASFHASAETGERISTFGRFEVVARNARENFEQAAPQIGTTLTQSVFERLQELTEAALARHRHLIEERARRGMPRDTHGDLRLGHVYFLPEKKPPSNLAIIDCIEFNERFRFGDPVADVAFLMMGFAFHGRRDFAERFSDTYFQASGDQEGRALVPFYTAYRAAVRGKVEGFKLSHQEIPDAERKLAFEKARGYWLLALSELESPKKKPCLVLIGGLPATGKSTLAKHLAQGANFHVIRSDVVRKELAGVSEQTCEHDREKRNDFEEGIYSPAWTERTYAECLHRAEQLLLDGERVIVDAGFWVEQERARFLQAARRLCVAVVMLLCTSKPDVVKVRLHSRKNDASDADLSVYQNATTNWEPPSQQTLEVAHYIETGSSESEVLAHAIELLSKSRLFR